MDGVSDIPVAGQDDDLLHLGTMASMVPQITQAAQQAFQAGQIQQMMPQLISVYNHAQAHLQSAQGKKIAPKLLEPFAQQLTGMQQMLQQVQGGVPVPPNQPASSPMPPQPNQGVPPPKHRGPHPHGGPMTNQQADQRRDQLHPDQTMQADSIFQNNPQPIPPSPRENLSKEVRVNLNTKV